MAQFGLKLVASIPDIDPEDFDRHQMSQLIFSIAATEAYEEKEGGRMGSLGLWKMMVRTDEDERRRNNRAIRRGLIVPREYA